LDPIYKDTGMLKTAPGCPVCFQPLSITLDTRIRGHDDDEEEDEVGEFGPACSS
jgi:hypothetical protein